MLILTGCVIVYAPGPANVALHDAAGQLEAAAYVGGVSGINASYAPLDHVAARASLDLDTTSGTVEATLGGGWWGAYDIRDASRTDDDDGSTEQTRSPAGLRYGAALDVGGGLFVNETSIHSSTGGSTDLQFRAVRGRVVASGLLAYAWQWGAVGGTTRIVGLFQDVTAVSADPYRYSHYLLGEQILFTRVGWRHVFVEAQAGYSLPIAHWTDATEDQEGTWPYHLALGVRVAIPVKALQKS